jgi:hypothetical protein
LPGQSTWLPAGAAGRFEAYVSGVSPGDGDGWNGQRVKLRGRLGLEVLALATDREKERALGNFSRQDRRTAVADQEKRGVGAEIEAALDHGLILAVARETLLLQDRQHPPEEQRLRLGRRRDGHHRCAEEHDCKRTAGAATESGNGCHGDNETRPITEPRTAKLEPVF